MKAITGILIFLSCLTSVTAQRICGSDNYTAALLKSNPALQAAYQDAENQIKKTTAKSNLRFRDTAQNELINIPVVIHVIYKTAVQNISDAQIQSQLISLNNDFAGINADRANTPKVFRPLAADVRIKFCIAQVDPRGNKTTGIIRKYSNTEVFFADDAMKFNNRGGDDAWDSKRYLNIWVCALGGRSLGYAAIPGGPSDVDGVVIAYDAFGTTGTLRPLFNKGRTATHETGHWMGLKHVWGDTDCGDDGVDDTPRQKSYNYGCPSFPHITSCSVDERGDMFMNYMDFSDDACMNMFTYGQKNRMRALFAKGNLRNSFLVSFACDSNLAQGGALPDTAAKVVAPALVKIYPNPAESAITIQCKTASKLALQPLQIFTVTGTKVYAATLSSEETRFAISFLTPGLYIVKVGEGKDATTSKLIKK